MTKRYVLILLAAVCVQCNMPSQSPDDKMPDKVTTAKNDPSKMFFQYWRLQDAENPTSRDVAFKGENGAQYVSGILFMTDSTVLENPLGDMQYGTFSRSGNTIQVKYDGGRDVKYTIGRMNENELLLRRFEAGKSSELIYKPSHTYWADATKNPFAKSNYQWAIKPKAPESADAIRQRAKQSVLFYTFYFNGVVDGGASAIDFEAIPCCFNWYTGGIGIQSEPKLDAKWRDCFYSEEQAFAARQLLQDAITQKYDWDTTQTNWVRQTALVLKQIHERL